MLADMTTLAMIATWQHLGSAGTACNKGTRARHNSAQIGDAGPTTPAIAQTGNKEEEDEKGGGREGVGERTDGRGRNRREGRRRAYRR